jgi:dTDP-4-amino-4,6-dideoxygalactose transaminase
MKVPYVDLGAQWLETEDESLSEISRILRGGKSIGDPIIEQLESEISEFLGVKHCISLNSGTDALIMGLMSLGVSRKDEVITVANSFIASTAAIAHIGAIPKFIDVGEDHLMDPHLIESAITSKTKAIMPVHLEGKMCDMPTIRKIADNYGLYVIEDAAQSFGSSFSQFQPGQLSDLACFSFHPLKNLNGIGDGGFIATNREDVATRVSRIRNHGLVDRDTALEFGFVSRLDSIQAAILSIRLRTLGKVISIRNTIASQYDSGLDYKYITTPVFPDQVRHTYHLYVIEIDSRDLVQNELGSLGIQTKIHYPKLICDQPAYKAKFGEFNEELPNTRRQAERILSIPIHQNLSSDQIQYVIDSLNQIVAQIAK